MVNGVAFSHPAEGEEGRVEKKVGGGEKSLKRKRTALGDKGKGREGIESDGEEDFSYDTTAARGSPRLLSCGVDKTVKLWDLQGSSGIHARVRNARHVSVRCLELTCSGSFFSLCKRIKARLLSSKFDYAFLRRND